MKNFHITITFGSKPKKINKGFGDNGRNLKMQINQIEVIKIEIGKMTPQEGDTIVLKLANFEKFQASKINSMMQSLKENYPGLKFIIIGANDNIEILKKELKHA
jgi:hypothetical protein